ncbi:HAD family phosphatase [Candidatus Dojkabacteria bacterium]|nr:HAD family phosphatase [Candidatus Dojkabacteria bacterium]
MIKAILLDMDGVIIESELAKVEYLKKLFIRYKLQITDKIIYTCIGKSVKDFLSINIPDKLIAEQILSDFFSEYLANITNYAIPIYPTINFIKDNFQKYKLALVSNGLKDINTKILSTYKISNCFDVILTRESVTNMKPNPEIYLLALKSLDIRANECIAIEDSVTGVQAALSAKIKTYVLKTSYYTKDHFDHFDIEDYIDNINQIKINTYEKQ